MRRTAEGHDEGLDEDREEGHEEDRAERPRRPPRRHSRIPISMEVIDAGLALPHKLRSWGRAGIHLSRNCCKDQSPHEQSTCSESLQWDSHHSRHR